jgi:peptidoglycan/LPS O-acetylase OafA/YrhL
LSKTTQYSQLNFIRGSMALYVLVCHCAKATGFNLKPLPGAGHAVDIFMMLSGLLIALNFHEREKYEPWNKAKTFYKFYIRRFFRIAPLYYFFLFFAFLFLDSFFAISNIRPGQNITSWTPELTKSISSNLEIRILLHVTFLFGLFPSFIQDSILPDWSIGLEMQFYFIFPFLMLIIKKIGYFIPLFLFTILYLIAPFLFGSYTSPGILLHFGQPSFLPLKINVFLIGILLGEAKYFMKIKKNEKAFKSLFFVFILSFIGYDFIINISAIYLLFWVISTSQILNTSLFHMFKKIDNFLDNKIVTFFSDTSYAVYLVHLLIIYLANWYFLNYKFYILNNYFYNFILLVVFSIPVSYSTAFILYRIIELPFIQFGKKISLRFFRNYQS